MRLSAESERKVLPVASRCLDVMMDAAESIQPRKDTGHVVEVYKSGFDPPGDVEFEDYSATMRRSISESSYLDNRAEGRRHTRKLWPFLRKNKLLHLLSSPRQPPPPPPTSPSPGEVVNSSQSPPTGSREPITQRLSDLMSSGSRTRKHCLRSLKRGVCIHIPTNLNTTVELMAEEAKCPVSLLLRKYIYIVSFHQYVKRPIFSNILNAFHGQYYPLLAMMSFPYLCCTANN
ncbi:hypothetical protein CHARACLAT_026391 [Characodon lateralis]|uniref:Uncharacterized protein n=1 Tax=Characodon lateralis TaxID=208331 RepID=A0ABU7EEG7_9TELE|nr:hypothetical protein [Characodon lateralis]